MAPMCFDDVFDALPTGRALVLVVELELDVDVDTDVDEDAVVCAIVVLEVGEDDRQEMSGPYST